MSNGSSQFPVKAIRCSPDMTYDRLSLSLGPSMYDDVHRMRSELTGNATSIQVNIQIAAFTYQVLPDIALSVVPLLIHNQPRPVENGTL